MKDYIPKPKADSPGPHNPIFDYGVTHIKGHDLALILHAMVFAPGAVNRAAALKEVIELYRMSLEAAHEIDVSRRVLNSFTLNYPEDDARHLLASDLETAFFGKRTIVTSLVAGFTAAARVAADATQSHGEWVQPLIDIYDARQLHYNTTSDPVEMQSIAALLRRSNANTLELYQRIFDPLSATRSAVISVMKIAWTDIDNPRDRSVYTLMSRNPAAMILDQLKIAGLTDVFTYAILEKTYDV